MKESLSGFGLAVLMVLASSVAGHAQPCNMPASDVVSTISLPGTPASAIPTRDGCTIFISMNEAQGAIQGHIAVFARSAGKIFLVRDVPVPNQGNAVLDLALTHDGKLLAATNLKGVFLLDVRRLLAGDGKPIVEANDTAGIGAKTAGSSHVVISPDDRLAFVSDESANAITVYDLVKLRRGETDAIGRISTGEAPVGLIFSPDGKKLYATSEVAKPGSGPTNCPAPDGVSSDERQGSLMVVDVARAAIDPSGSVLAEVPAGCDTVRVTLSDDGSRAFVTARYADSLLDFDTSKLVTDSGHALIATMTAGKAPVGVAVVGQYVVTADSNRFSPAGRKGEWLSVIDRGTLRLIGNVPVGLFPRDLFVTADEKALLVLNSNSNSVELVSVDRLTPAYFALERPIKDADDAEQIRVQVALQERIKNHQAATGTEEALRHLIVSILRGMPDYDAMGPQVANIMRQRSARYAAQFQQFGALISVRFQSTSRNGVDEFEVTFEHARTDWGISLSADGKAAILGLDSVK